jgi:hypothetical protein
MVNNRKLIYFCILFTSLNTRPHRKVRTTDKNQAISFEAKQTFQRLVNPKQDAAKPQRTL